MIKRLALAFAVGIATALLSATAAFASTGLNSAMSVRIERGRYPTSGLEMGLMAGGVVVLIAIGFLLRYLSRPRKRKEGTREDKTPESEAANDDVPGDQGS